MEITSGRPHAARLLTFLGESSQVWTGRDTDGTSHRRRRPLCWLATLLPGPIRREELRAHGDLRVKHYDYGSKKSPRKASLVGPTR